MCELAVVSKTNGHRGQLIRIDLHLGCPGLRFSKGDSQLENTKRF